MYAQGELSGFQSHCRHHVAILQAFEKAGERMESLETAQQTGGLQVASGMSALEQALSMFRQHAHFDTLYSGSLFTKADC